MSDTLLALSFFFHLVATIVWLGGLVFMIIIVWPETRTLIARQDQSGALLDLLDRLRKRFYPLANLSLVVLIVTGLFQMGKNPHYDGLFQFTNDWTRAILLKHVAILGMLIPVVLLQWTVIPPLYKPNFLFPPRKQPPHPQPFHRPQP